MNKIVSSVLVIGSLALLGGACYKASNTNTNVNVVVNTNESNSNVSANINTESNTNTSVNTNTPSVRSGWTSYTNEEYGFRFQYPSSMAVDKSYILTSNLNTSETFSLIQINFQENYPTPIFSVNVAFNDLDTTIDQITQPDVSSSMSQDSTVLGGKDVKVVYIAGPEGKKVIYAYPSGDKTILISVPDGSTYVEIVNTFVFTE